VSIELRELRCERPVGMMFYPCTAPPLGAPARAEADELIAATRRLIPEGPGFLSHTRPPNPPAEDANTHR
jgi:hypothetical protein